MPTVRQRYVSELDRLIARGDRLDKRQARRLLQLLNQARLEVQDHITGTDWSIASSTVLELRIQRTMARIAADWQLDISEYQAQRWNDGAAVADEFLADFGGEAERLNIPLETTQLNVLQDFSAKLVKDLTKKVIDDISTTIRMGILGGKTPFETIKDLGRKLVDKDGKPAPGVWGTVAQRAEVVQRTEANRAFGLAQQARLEQHERERPGLKKTWRTAADSRVRESHVDAGERYLPGGDPGPIPVGDMFELRVSSSEASKGLPAGTYRARYPRDPRLPPGLSVQCRCVSSPWRDEWEGV